VVAKRGSSHYTLSSRITKLHSFYRASTSRTVHVSNRTVHLSSRTESLYPARKINRTVPYRGYVRFALESIEREPNRIRGPMYGTVRFGTDSPVCIPAWVVHQLINTKGMVATILQLSIFDVLFFAFYRGP
jgi:hypothetical protein